MPLRDRARRHPRSVASLAATLLTWLAVAGLIAASGRAPYWGIAITVMLISAGGASVSGILAVLAERPKGVAVGALALSAVFPLAAYEVLAHLSEGTF